MELIVPILRYSTDAHFNKRVAVRASWDVALSLVSILVPFLLR
jgi:hypothetical protein